MAVSSAADMHALHVAFNTPEATSHKILELSAGALEALHGAWKTFAQPQLDQFMNRLKHYPSNTCCLQEHPPGWVW
eukprot:365202-Chlamydomonas_euryale.AAC.3